jgi:hypothetical protein
LTLLAAPTVGDIGSCGQDLVELDPVKFFAEKAFIDCQRCQDCEISSDSCRAACRGELERSDFPRDCFPLVHDGEVCLNALRAAGCSDYELYVDDEAPTVPTECNFCPFEEAPRPPEQDDGSGGGDGTGGAGGGS